MLWKVLLVSYLAIGGVVATLAAVTRQSPTVGEIILDFAVLVPLWPCVFLPQQWFDWLF
jgi:hypothetical protein